MDTKDGAQDQTTASQGQEGKGTAALAQKYKDYENNKELVKDDNPYR